jgi:hypothetical protein
MELLCDAVHKVAQEVVTVNGTDTDADRIETLTFLFEIDRYDGVTLLGRKTDGGSTVAFMDLNRAIRILEADDFVSRKRMTVRASDVTALGLM